MLIFISKINKRNVLRGGRFLMKKNAIISAVVLSLSLSVTMTACSNRLTGSEQGDEGYKAFSTILKENKDKVGFHAELSHWGYTLPTGEKFEWTKDTSANVADMALVMLADPFINAGLDVKKLDNKEWLYNPAAVEEGKEMPNRLIKPYNVSDKKQQSSGSEDAMRRIIRTNPDLLKYSSETKKYRISLGDGFEAQWTEKPGITDSDMVFVLNAEPLVKAGLDTKKLDGSGWVFKTGNNDTPDQLVKTFKLK